MSACLVSRLALIAGAAFALAQPAAARQDYVASVQTVAAPADQTAESARGVVFHDLSRDGIRQDDEPGLAGVIVSNGREAVVTAADGSYELPVWDNMTVMVTKPAGYAVPTTADGVPQYFYHHKPAGTPANFRFGGLPPTGPLPAEINFPLVRQAESDRFSCVTMGDTQPYSNDEVGYVRDSVLRSVLNRDLSAANCMILLGDVMGDDLGLLPRLTNTMAASGLPQYYIHGNHDFDFDATSDDDSADSWRNLYGPNYYAFEIGKVFFVALDNVVYPCTAAEAREGDRARCGSTEGNPIYNGRVTDTQMAWLEATLAHVPQDRLIVLMHHIPLVSFIDSNTGRHQTDNAQDIYRLIGSRPALSLSGHTHTLEFLAAGEWFKGWEAQVGVKRLPFDHIVAGAPSGNWYFGDMSFDGTPMAFGRCGTPPGYMMIDFDGTDWQMTFHAANQDPARQMALSFNTPAFREWFDTLYAWHDALEETSTEAPPLTTHDLADVKLFTPQELGGGVFLTANVWGGSRDSSVTVRLGEGPEVAMTRTQAGNGEDMLSGAAYADPFAVARQMTIGRYAYASQATDTRTQGFEIWTGEAFGPAVPQGGQTWMYAKSSPHLWQWQMPADLPQGAHVATVTHTDRWGRVASERIVFEVRGERPPRFWRKELWPSN